MSRQKVGIFGALVAVGGVLAWRWAQRHRSSQAGLNRELSRWEDEGGSLATSTQTAPSHPTPLASAVGAMGERSNGAAGQAWPFPQTDTRNQS